ncbi:DUF2061 domain-containing protein [Neptunicella marina]|uniref:DUF2061 domain-containing protein n=1 Tax=Neptunicella marina TaxID=2125989 RepID=A0A8J6M1S6_9ALTE|nr:DUF2061 domain-containing protein [Neptunicella marina]MBC3767739.1 DUF2061 domain-containing protein [Neptunicella marina]
MKTVTFTIMHFAIAFSVAYVLTGSWTVGGLIALVEPLVNSVGYAVHEHIWSRAGADDFSNQPLIWRQPMI